MFCHAHTDRQPVAKCTRCGALVCGECRQRRWGRAVCPACVAPRVVVEAPRAPIPPAQPFPAQPNPHYPTPQPVPTTPAQPAPRPGRRPSARAAGILGAVPGLGHVYAGNWFRGLLLLALAPVAWKSMVHGGMPVPLYAFLHGLVAFDGYRLARKRNGAWSREDSREARGVWVATAGALLLLGLSGAGVALSPWLVAAVLIPLGVGLMLGGRRDETPAIAAAVAPAHSPAPQATAAAAHPECVAGPGQMVDRRADRAALAAALHG